MRRIKKEKLLEITKKKRPIALKAAINEKAKKSYDLVLIGLLEILDKSNYRNPILFCFNELYNNTLKANIKRVYFHEKKLDINDPADSLKGLLSMKEDTENNIDHYYKLHNKENLYIHGIFRIVDHGLKIMIINNTPLTEHEFKRINERITTANRIQNMAEAYEILDETESAGFGIVMIIMMMKNMGLSADEFTIRQNDKGETISSIFIDFTRVEKHHENILSIEIVKEIENVPIFPDNIMKIQKILSEQSPNLSKVYRIIKRDPAITTDILQYVNMNSEYFELEKSVESVKDAISIVGIEEIRNNLLSYETEKIMDSRYQKMSDMWKHANKTALIAKVIAKYKKLSIATQNNLFITGILHDIGKIILLNLQPELIKKINVICRELGAKPDFFEKWALGINHAKIGGMIAQKWN
ncbi:MAG: HDOD domain-containing protein, partial [Actinomycetia bacterium]|nr:HDOD domain-containing protein [Actinomycetes bacterium]